MSQQSIQIFRVFTKFILLFLISATGYSQIQNVENIRQLRALSPGIVSQINVGGYYTSGDGGGGIFVWNGSNTRPDNNGTIIRPLAGGTGRWERMYEEHINILWFGARGDNKPYSDNHIRIQSALDYAATSSVKKVYIPKGIYQLSGQIVLNQYHNGIELYGELNYTTIPRQQILDMVGDRYSWVDELHAWSENDPKYADFRVVDESNSSILKRVLDWKNEWTGSTAGILWIENHNNLPGVVSNMTFRSFAVDGNRQKHGVGEEGNDVWVPVSFGELSSDWNWQGFGNNIVTRRSASHNYDAGNLLFENVASYGASRSGFWLSLKGTTANNVFAYNNGQHGIAVSSRHAVMNGKNWEAHHNGIIHPFGGSHGADFHGTCVVDNVHSHHNREGVKTASESIYLDIDNLVSEYNAQHGFQQTETPDKGTYIHIRRIETRGNGWAGLRFVHGETRIADHVVAGNNGLIDRNGLWPNIFASDVKFGTVISKNYNGYADYSIYFFGADTDVQYLEIIDNEKPGMIIFDGITTVYSGHIYNNDNIGIFIGNHRDGSSTAILHNVVFGSKDGTIAFRQTYRDITCNGYGRLIHSGLDFSNSKVSPGNWIRVSTVEKK